MGSMPVRMGSTSGSTTSAATAVSKEVKPFAPGDAIGAVLLNGDFTVAATGTVTHVDGDHIYAFGHPFLDLGDLRFPTPPPQIAQTLPTPPTPPKIAHPPPTLA